MSFLGAHESVQNEKNCNVKKSHLKKGQYEMNAIWSSVN